jgi:hypothetical protein
MAMAGSEAKRSPKPGRHAFTVQGACTECMGLGWFPANELSEIQRCDNCKVFESDEDAHAHALELAADALTRPRRRSGKRYDCIIEAVRIAAWEKAGRPDGSFEGCELD